MGAGRDKRPFRDYNRPTAEKFNGSYYFFASDVFDLSSGGKKLSKEEVDNLPVRINYSGEEVEFDDDEKEAFTILMRIISNGNKMQYRRYVSFPLGRFMIKTSLISTLSKPIQMHLLQLKLKLKTT